MGSRGSLDLSKEKHELVAYCPDDISKVFSKEGALSRPFHVADLTEIHKVNVQLRAYVDFFGGYAEHGRQILFGLQDSGQCQVGLLPITSPVDIDPILHQKCTFFVRNPGFNKEKSIFLTIAGPGWADKQYVPQDRYSIIWTMIETQKAIPEIGEWLKNVKEVWAPTDIDVKRFKSLNLPNIKRMHLGFDPNKYHPKVEPLDIYNLRGRYVFGVVGSWNKRKNVKTIVRAFCRAFKQEDNVSLLLVCKYGTRPYDGFRDGKPCKKEDKETWDINYELQEYLKDFKNKPHITLVDRPIHDNVLPHLAARVNCLVGASLGESTWLPGLEFLGMGRAIIQAASECSGFMEYLDDDNSYLCKNGNYVEADEELYLGTSDYYKGEKFWEVEEDELVYMMDRVYNERNYFEQKVKIQNGYNTSKNWTWQIAVNRVVSRLKEIECGNI